MVFLAVDGVSTGGCDAKWSSGAAGLVLVSELTITIASTPNTAMTANNSQVFFIQYFSDKVSRKGEPLRERYEATNLLIGFLRCFLLLCVLVFHLAAGTIGRMGFLVVLRMLELAVVLGMIGHVARVAATAAASFGRL